MGLYVVNQRGTVPGEQIVTVALKYLTKTIWLISSNIQGWVTHKG